jgi:hypothetical protein
MKKAIIQSLIAILFLAWETHAQAHAFLDHADPRVGSTITHSPAQMKLWFTQNLEPAFSKVEVRDARGTEVDKRDAHLDATAKDLFVVSLLPLKPGTYTVTWRVVSVDTHKTQGHFEFTLK